MMNEKIKKWQSEIEKITAAQKEYNNKCSEKIKNLNVKINIEEKKLKQENDEMIADVVRDLFGEVNAENIESFKEKIQLLTGLEEEVDEGSQDNFSGDAGGIRSY